jgi:hypothetical protein
MKYVAATLIFMAACGAGSRAHAGPYGDDMAKCLVESTTADDRVALVRWMFAAAAAHPAVASIATVTAEEREKLNISVAKLFTKLLTESCLEQSKKAIKYDGMATMQLSFQVLGQVAGQELFSNPEVAKATASLQTHIDSKRLEMLKE